MPVEQLRAKYLRLLKDRISKREIRKICSIVSLLEVIPIDEDFQQDQRLRLLVMKISILHFFSEELVIAKAKLAVSWQLYKWHRFYPGGKKGNNLTPISCPQKRSTIENPGQLSSLKK